MGKKLSLIIEILSIIFVPGVMTMYIVAFVVKLSKKFHLKIFDDKKLLTN